MKNRFVRIVAGFLFACMVAGSVPVEAVYGIENNVENGQDEEQSLPENRENIGNLPDDANASDEERINEDQGDGNNQHSNQQSSSESSKEVADSLQVDEADGLTEAVNETLSEDEGESTIIEGGEKISAGEIDYVYIESPYLQTPGTQRIVFSFGQQITGVDTISLTVEDEAGNQEDWELSEQTENLYLFEKAYTGDAYSGTYHAVSLNLSGEDEKMIMLDEVGIEAEFGVNQEYEGIEKLEPLDETATEEEIAQVGASVVTIDENGVVEAQDSIADALNAVSASTSAGTSTFSASARSASTRSKNFIVALDPGHDANDAGASANGLREEVLTLKIANYCKKELEQYNGVTVIMTRTGAACPFNCTSAGSCIRQRVQWAVNQGAQVFISFHLNASTSSSANGAEVIVPNYSWKPALGTAGRQLAEKILDELEDLGLTRRSIYSKNTTVGEKYEDGSISDYFSVQIYCKENDIPGIIVEHAFITNSSDVNNYLKTEAGLKSLGVADATGIAKYLGLSKGYWETDAQGNKYYYADGVKVKGVYKIGNNFYYFDPVSGIMYTGWRQDEKDTYYYKSDGRLAFGVEKIDGAWYYFKEDDGTMYTGWRKNGNCTYYYDSSGKLVFGTNNINGSWYYFNENDGVMHTGWRKDGEDIYYYDKDGKLCFGAQKIEGSWYYFNKNDGTMHTGWREDGEDTYYYDKDGKLCFGAPKIEGNWYYFNKNDGTMHTGWRKDGKDTYYYDKDGKLLFGSQEIGGGWYYFDDDSAVMHIGWYENSNNKKLYYDKDGKSARGCYKIDSNWYYFDENTGEMLIGWRQDGKDTYYYNDKGQLMFGEQNIDGHWYYFNKNNGIMHIGWRSDGGNTYYYEIDGTLTFGIKVIDGVEYYFNTNTGALVEKSDFTAILGENTVTIKQMVDFYNANSPIAYPSVALSKGGASTLEAFAQIFYEEASAEGIRVEVAWCQSMLETGWLEFGGQVDISQFNFAGLGATDGGAKGADFSSYGSNGVRMGIRAQIQHLKAYADPDITESTLHYSCVDSRFAYVSPKGCAPYVEYLGQKENPSGKGWATEERYGYRIAELIESLKKM